jgi:hypothetical protein
MGLTPLARAKEGEGGGERGGEKEPMQFKSEAEREEWEEEQKVSATTIMSKLSAASLSLFFLHSSLLPMRSHCQGKKTWYHTNNKQS